MHDPLPPTHTHMEVRGQTQLSVLAPTLFETASLAVHLCVLQANWPQRFQGFSCFCLPLGCALWHWAFCRFWRVQFRWSHLHAMYFTHRVIPPSSLFFLTRPSQVQVFSLLPLLPVLGIDLRGSHMRGRCCATELQLQPSQLSFSYGFFVALTLASLSRLQKKKQFRVRNRDDWGANPLKTRSSGSRLCGFCN